MSIFRKQWGKSTARGDIEQYALGRKRISENWVIGHLKFVMRFSGITKDFMFQTISEIETLPIYRHLRTSEAMIKLKNLRERIKKEL